MKKVLLLITAACLAFTLFTGCAGNTGGDNVRHLTEDSTAPADASGTNTNAAPAPAGDESATGGVTLDSMQKAAADAGYTVEDGYIFQLDDNVVNAITVIFPSPDGDEHTPICEFKSAADADAYAKTVNDAGYNVCIVNGKYLTMASAEKSVVSDGNEQAFLENLLYGRELSPAP